MIFCFMNPVSRRLTALCCGKAALVFLSHSGRTDLLPAGLPGVGDGLGSGVGAGGGAGMSALANRGSKSSRIAS